MTIAHDLLINQKKRKTIKIKSVKRNKEREKRRRKEKTYK